MAIADTITSMTTHLEDAYTSLENLGTDTSQIDRNLENLSSEIDEIYDALPKVTAEGTDLELSNTKKGKLVVTQKGNSSQFSTTGKNLLPNNLTSQTINGITVTVNDDGSVICNGTATANTSLILTRWSTTKKLNLTAGSYKLSGTTTGAVETYRIMLYKSDFTYITECTNQTRTFTLSEDCTNMVCTISIKEGATVNNVLFQPMIRLSSITDDTYEPYTGGIPAPNPDYPYPVKVVTGENSLVISNKNLININLLFGNTTYYSINSDKEVTLTTADTRNFNSLDGTTWGMHLEAGTYTISYNPNSHGSLQVSQKDVGTIITNVALSTGKASFTLTQSGIIGVKFIGLTGYLPYTPGHIQIEKGSTATEYVEHREQLPYSISLGNIELCKVGDYQDYIYGNPNHWYKKEVIRKVILNGSENWENQYDDSLFDVQQIFDYRPFIVGYGLSNYYKYNPIQTGMIAGLNNGEFALQKYSTSYSIFIRNNNYTTVADFKNWLSTHNTEVYYIRETPLDFQITDETLISQLNNIYNNAYSYNGTTNITTTYADGNAQMIIDASALKSWEVTE